jgi:molybdate transport system permease protein
MNIDFTPFIVSLKLSSITTLILFIFGMPVSAFIAYKKFKLKPVVESIITLPLVLPPTVIGFYLLLLLSPHWIIGSFFERYFNVRLVFSFTGIVIASCIYSIPFMIQSLKNGMESIDMSLIEASYSLGKGRIETFFRIIIPNMKNFIVTGLVMTFSHTMGEFGVILMLGGNIEGQTRVASIAIYDKVEQLDYHFAFVYSLILISISVLILVFLNYLNAGRKKDLIL